MYTCTSLLYPPPVPPPNNKLVVLVIDVKVKASIGGGLSPVTVGEVHSPKNNKNNINTHTLSITALKRSLPSNIHLL